LHERLRAAAAADNGLAAMMMPDEDATVISGGERKGRVAVLG